MIRQGWRNEGWRHSLASRGIKTNSYMKGKIASGSWGGDTKRHPMSYDEGKKWRDVSLEGNEMRDYLMDERGMSKAEAEAAVANKPDDSEFVVRKYMARKGADTSKIKKDDFVKEGAVPFNPDWDDDSKDAGKEMVWNMELKKKFKEDLIDESDNTMTSSEADEFADRYMRDRIKGRYELQQDSDNEWDTPHPSNNEMRRSRELAKDWEINAKYGGKNPHWKDRWRAESHKNPLVKPFDDIELAKKLVKKGKNK